MPFRSLSRRSRDESRSHRRSTDTSRTAEPKNEPAPAMTFPTHPLPSMQAPFEESMLDSTGESGCVPYAPPTVNIEQRQLLLCRKEVAESELEWNFSYNAHWRRYPMGKHHPLLKTVTQIAFGIHLLHQQLEKSVADVADILLKHVNELDTFLHRANEDIDSSLQDMLFRRQCLKVPMEHVTEFDRLLEDRGYRAQLLDGNIVIERTISRMSVLLNDYITDMSAFRDANIQLDTYLNDIGGMWCEEDNNAGQIYSAMRGNTAGWAHFLQSLMDKTEKLGVVLVQVSSYCNEIEKRCGAASRRSMVASRSSSRNSSNSRDAAPFRHFEHRNKPLPMVPNERPPFIPPSASESASSLDVAGPRASARQANKQTGQFDSVIDPSSSQPDLQEQAASASATTRPRTERRPEKDEIYETDDDRKETRIHDGRSLTNHRLTEPVVQSKRPIENMQERNGKVTWAARQAETSHSNETVVQKKGHKGDTSPLLTGKDSAYSSVSGGSFASPTAPHPPRSASAQSSYPRAQFGLFPTSTPSTPQQSLNGRYGAMSPTQPSPKMQEQQFMMQRSQSSLDGYNPSSKRLLRKGSLSTFKKLFTKKKHSSVEPIAE